MKKDITIFFDCFGTLFSNPGSIDIAPLLDTILEIKSSDKKFLSFLWNQCYREIEEKSRISKIEFSMDDIAYKMSSFHAKYDLSTYQKIKELYMEHWIKKIFLFPDVREVLYKLSKRYYLGIISNTNDSKIIPDLLEKHSISSYFSYLILSVDVGVRKPSPQIFDYAKRICGNKILCFVGDNYFDDINGAQKSEILPIYINREKKKIGDVNSIETMMELIDIIQQYQ